jgi:hypothetical protein
MVTRHELEALRNRYRDLPWPPLAARLGGAKVNG